MDANNFFKEIIDSRKSMDPKGVCSICSAHPLVLQAALEYALEKGMPLLIESTANQVNQHGGYTGMTPNDFRDYVYDMAGRCGFPHHNIILGGDHLGPFVWRDRPSEEAMQLAEELVEAYVMAGFEKIHIDTSMHLLDDDSQQKLSGETIAIRGARICAAAEKAYLCRKKMDAKAVLPVYVIGSEVPSPGGLKDTQETLHPTSPESFLSSFKAFKNAFDDFGLKNAFSRIIAFVVQPGVEFDSSVIFEYDSDKASKLRQSIDKIGHPLVFEGHSTDYQTKEALKRLVCDGFAILKVGPALTFALREALIALEIIEKELLTAANVELSKFSEALESAMLINDRHWRDYYIGNENDTRILRRYSYLDRTRYYLNEKDVLHAIDILCKNLELMVIPEIMLSQYLPSSYIKVRAGLLKNNPLDLIIEHIKEVLDYYY